MSSAKAKDPRTPRLNELFDNLSATLKDFIRKHHVTYEEYHHALAFLTETGETGEIPLLFDVYLEMTVDDVDHRGRPGTETTVEGPYYVTGAPELKSPCVLPQRAKEPGDVLIFSGNVRGIDGAALDGAVVDFWQADSEGRYSHFNIKEEEAPFNLRAKVIADRHGHFEMQTRVPAAYEIPKHGPTGRLIKALGSHPWRPAHVHVRVTHPGFAPLTTQVFLKDDPWIDQDVVGAVKESLIMGMTRHDDATEIKQRGLTRPFFTLNYDFVLPREMAEAA